jgi:hypothetical protein
MMRRAVSVLRDARHGGTVIFIPLENAGDLSAEHPYIDLRYPFADGRARLSFPDLIVDILNRLARLYGSADHEHEPKAVDWGNVRRLIIRNQDDEVLLEVPLTAGVVVGGAVTIVAPVLAAMGALAALLTHVKIEVIRARKGETDGERSS